MQSQSSVICQETPIENVLNTPNNSRSCPSGRIWKELTRRIGRQKFDMWFAHTRLRLNGKHLELATDSQFVSDWIDSHFSDDLHEAASNILGRSVPVEICVEAQPASGNEDLIPQGPLSLRDRSASRPGRLRSGPDEREDRDPHQPHSGPGSRSRLDDHAPRHRGEGPRRGAGLRRLDDFVVGSCNRLAFSTASRLAQEPEARCISPLFIHGDCGVGKTHLLQGVCHHLIQSTGRARHVRYVTAEQFTNEYIASVRNNTIEEFRQRIRKLDLLAIDDVHFFSNKVRTQGEFLCTLDAIDLSGARVVLASDNHPHQIKRFDKALISRFLSGMVVKVDRPDRATRLELINRLAGARGLRLNAAAAETLAGHYLGSMREIEGAITKLAACQALMNGQNHDSTSSEDDGEIGLVLTEQLLKEQAQRPAQFIRLSAVIDTVCARLMVSKADLMGSNRHRRIVLARSLVAYLSRELTTHSFPEIAQALGRVNHSTIHTADQRLRGQIIKDEPVGLGPGEAELSLKELIDQLRRDVMDHK